MWYAKTAENELEMKKDGGHGERHEEHTWLSLAEAKELFLRDSRLLSKETQRWHRENLTAVEKALVKLEIDVSDVRNFTAPLMKEHAVFYMFEEMGMKTNTINGRICSVRALTKFLCSRLRRRCSRC